MEQITINLVNPWSIRNGRAVSVHRSDAENRKVFGRFDQPCSHPVVYFLEQWKN